MAETNGRAVAEEQAPLDTAVPAAVERPPDESVREARAVDDALDAFSRTVAHEVDAVTDDVVDARLNSVLHRLDRWYDTPRHRREVDELSGYAFGLVRLWLSLILPHGGPALDELARDTVAQALTAFADGPPARAVFLARCVSALPQAYRRWRLRGGPVELDELAALTGAPARGDTLVADLRRYAMDANPTRSWQGDDLAATREALRIADDSTDGT